MKNSRLKNDEKCSFSALESYELKCVLALGFDIANAWFPQQDGVSSWGHRPWS